MTSATPVAGDLFVQKMNQLVFGADTITACGSYSVGGYIHTTSGVYHDTVASPAGMDSILTLDLTINPLPVPGVITGPDTVCAGGTIVLSDTATGGSWHALNANASVTGGIVAGASYGTDTIVYIASNDCGLDSAFHTVTVKNCIDAVPVTSGPQTLLHIIPNPGNGLFYVTLSTAWERSAKVSIADALGKVVLELEIDANKEYPVKLDVPAGVYYLNASTGHGSYSQKIVVSAR
jgi:hypothetical protein